jgi:hypothetical protein
MSKVGFELGLRVELSELGRKNAKSPYRRGIIVAVSRSGTSYRVRWDEHKVAEACHDSATGVASGA